MFVEVNKGLDSMLGDSREWIDVDIIMDEKEKERMKYAMHRVLVYRGMIHVPVEIVETMNYMCAILEEMGRDGAEVINAIMPERRQRFWAKVHKYVEMLEICCEMEETQKHDWDEVSRENLGTSGVLTACRDSARRMREYLAGKFVGARRGIQQQTIQRNAGNGEVETRVQNTNERGNNTNGDADYFDGPRAAM